MPYPLSRSLLLCRTVAAASATFEHGCLPVSLPSPVVSFLAKQSRAENADRPINVQYAAERRMRGETDTPACLARRVCRLARSPMLPFHDPSIRFVRYLYRSRHFSLCLASGWDGCERCGEGVSSIARGSTSSVSVCATIVKMGVSASWKAVCCLVSVIVIAITSASSDSQGILSPDMILVQRSAKVDAPGCVNAAVKLGQM